MGRRKRKSLTTVVITTFSSVLIYGIIQDYITRNYPNVNPIFSSALAAAIGVIIMFYLFGSGEE